MSASNDNQSPPEVTISFTDLAEGMRIDEDTLLERLAGILNKRAPDVVDQDGPSQR